MLGSCSPFGSGFRVRRSRVRAFEVRSCTGIRASRCEFCVHAGMLEQLCACGRGTRYAPTRAVGVRRFTDLRAWQACNVSGMWHLSTLRTGDSCLQIRRADGSSKMRSPAHPDTSPKASADSTLPTLGGSSSSRGRRSMESQNHLRDAVDKRYISRRRLASNTISLPRPRSKR